MQHPILFHYQNNPISFDFEDGHRMINAVQMAKPFGKKPAHFLRLSQTQEFIKVLTGQVSGIANSQSQKNKIIRIQNGGKHQGTWMHEKLALKFAAWLSPEFELWVYDRVQELLLQGHTSIRETHPPAYNEESAISQLETEWRFQRIERQVEQLRTDVGTGMAYIRTAMGIADLYRHTKGHEKEVDIYDAFFSEYMDTAVNRLKKLE